MRGSVSRETLPQWGYPRGLGGIWVAAVMAVKNVSFIQAALAAVAPLPAEARVLEIGCGDGTALRRLASRAPGAFLIGLDHSHLMIRRAAGRSGLHAVRGDACTLPFADGCLDAVLAVNTVQFWADPDMAFADVFRALKPGGRLVVTQRIGKLTWRLGVKDAQKGRTRLAKAAGAMGAQGFAVQPPIHSSVGKLMAGTLVGIKPAD